MTFIVLFSFNFKKLQLHRENGKTGQSCEGKQLLGKEKIDKVYFPYYEVRNQRSFFFIFMTEKAPHGNEETQCTYKYNLNLRQFQVHIIVT